MVCRNQVIIYFCQCDFCKTIKEVPKSDKIYNGAQAVRSLGWSFGKDSKVRCESCRKCRLVDKYRPDIP